MMTKDSEKFAERSYQVASAHWKRCPICSAAGGEAADPKAMCTTGRVLTETWEAAEKSHSAVVALEQGKSGAEITAAARRPARELVDDRRAIQDSCRMRVGTCIGYDANGAICGKPASHIDVARGGLVCEEHKPLEVQILEDPQATAWLKGVVRELARMGVGPAVEAVERLSLVVSRWSRAALGTRQTTEDLLLDSLHVLLALHERHFSLTGLRDDPAIQAALELADRVAARRREVGL